MIIDRNIKNEVFSVKLNVKKLLRFAAVGVMAASLQLAAAPLAFAADCADGGGQMDMSTWQNVLLALSSFLGGGRDLDVQNNIIVSGGERGISYDQRAIDGFYGGWFEEHSGQNGNMWRDLRNSPWKTELWQTAFPQMAAFSDDYSNPDLPGFVANPAGSTVANNLFVTGKRTIGEIGEKVLQYSEFSGNSLFRREQLRDLFIDPGHGDYTIKNDAPVFAFAPAFESLPLSQMGRCG